MRPGTASAASVTPRPALQKPVEAAFAASPRAGFFAAAVPSEARGVDETQVLMPLIAPRRA